MKNSATRQGRADRWATASNLKLSYPNLAPHASACHPHPRWHQRGMRFSAFLQSNAGTGLRYALSAAVLAALAWHVDWDNFRSLDSLDWSLALPAALLAGVAYPLQAWRWQVLLRTQDLHPPARWTHGVFWIGQFYNSFLPGGIAGDALRVCYLWRWQSNAKIPGTASVLADRVLGLGSLLLLAALALGFYLFGTHGVAANSSGLQALFLASGASLAAVLAGAWIATRATWWEHLLGRWLQPAQTAALHAATLNFSQHRRRLAFAVWLSVAVWLVDFYSVWLLARAVGLSVGLLETTVAAAAAYVAASLPISIGGHGVREGALLGTFALLGPGASDTTALASLALAFWAVSVLWSLVGGAVYLSALLVGWPLARATARISKP